MALTLILETGAGLANANSYATVAESDAYHDGHLYATAWTGATSGNKAAALVMATRLIDAEIQFLGLRTIMTQALQWPRTDVPNPDADAVLADNALPAVLVRATCEQARAMLIEDRTSNPMGEGLKFTSLASNQTSFDKNDRRPVLTKLVQVMLSKLGSQNSAQSGSVKLLRA